MFCNLFKTSIKYFSKVFFHILLAFARVTKRYFKEPACLFKSVCFPKRSRLIVGRSNECYSKEIIKFFFFFFFAKLNNHHSGTF